MDFLDTWKQWSPGSPPYILEEDHKLLHPLQNKWVLRNWEQAYKDPRFGEPKDKRFHLGLLPHPYCGENRVRRGEAIVIVTRKARIWNLEERPGVIVYDKNEARAARLGPNSPGGQEILKHLKKTG